MGLEGAGGGPKRGSWGWRVRVEDPTSRQDGGFASTKSVTPATAANRTNSEVAAQPCRREVPWHAIPLAIRSGGPAPVRPQPWRRALHHVHGRADPGRESGLPVDARRPIAGRIGAVSRGRPSGGPEAARDAARDVGPRRHGKELRFRPPP